MTSVLPPAADSRPAATGWSHGTVSQDAPPAHPPPQEPRLAKHSPPPDAPASSSSSPSSAPPPSDAPPNLAARRSVAARDHKAPLGPRALDQPLTSHRISHDPPSGPRFGVPSTVSEPFLGLSGRRTASQLPPAQTQQKLDAPTTDSATDTSSVDLPLRSGSTHARTRSRQVQDKTGSFPKTHTRVASTASRPRPTSPTQVSKNPAIRAAQISTDAANGLTSSTQLNVKTRRQSHFPPSSAPPVDSRAPRKSIGPGLVVTNAAERSARAAQSQEEETTALPPPPTTARKASNASTLGKPRLSMGAPSVTPVATIERLSRPKRDVKAQSMQPPPRAMPPPAPGAASQKAEDVSLAQSNIIARSPARPTLWRTNTPSAANRRQSTVSGRVSGLGARTISPTDARRLKRASAMPPSNDQVRSATNRSATPPEQPSFLHGRKLPSPAPPPKVRTSTPASNRNTPDLLSKAGATRIVSSRASYTSSGRPISSSGVMRPGSGGAKARSERGSGGTESEVVPPVPKIPQAFESPTDTKDVPFFQEVMSSIQSPENGQGPLSLAEETDSFAKLINSIGTATAETPAAVSAAQPSKRGSTLPNRFEGSKTGVAPHSRQYSNVPRLPPLNLAPLEVSAKYPNTQAHAQAKDLPAEAQTPPPRGNATKTPSTPMTASKATFASNDFRQEFDWDSLGQVRSGTSYGMPGAKDSTVLLQGSRSASPETFASYSPATPGPTKSPASTEAAAVRATPAEEAPVPKTAIPVVTRSRAQSNASTSNTNSNAGTKDSEQRQPSRLLGRRSRAASKTGKESQLGQVETESKEQQSSLRRRLSMSWRKSTSKPSKPDDLPKMSTSSNEMPPPKLPASASLANANKKDKEPIKTASRSHSRMPSSSALSGEATPRANRDKPNSSTTNLLSTTQNKETRESKLIKSESNSSFFSPMHKILGPRHAHAAPAKVPTPDMRLDKDDLAAEEEMKRLAARKKDFEASARELEDMRKRAAPKERVSPSQASKVATLNIFERGEIIDYKDIYFTGTRNAQKNVGDLSSTVNNFGFDDDRGDYNIVMGDHLAYRYEVVDLLGKGSFGQVVRCVDHRLGKLVAIKIIRNKKRFHQQALVEVNILQRLREWDPQNKHSMINFTQSFYFRGHLCISTELLGINLYEFIKAHDFRGFSLKLIRRFTKQLLSSLCLLQTKKVIHCDLKPENILLAHPLQAEIKVIDFGSSCLETEKVYTYIQSRFYRSPEVILGMNYGMPIDMWSLGCILAELLTGYPIFPGENEQEQLACIMEVFGPPEKHLIERATRKKLFFDSLGKPRVTVSSKGKRRRPSSKTLQQALKCDDEAFLDFITRCLRWDPEKRLKPDEAVQHEFITGVKKPLRARAPQRVASDRPLSPSKRTGTAGGSGSAGRPRPLPEPPAAANGSANGSANGHGHGSSFLSTSPTKHSAAPRRQSVLPPSSQGHKRLSTGPSSVSSGLPRASNSSNTRSFSGKPDLASAAAIASLQNQH